jgi:metal-sulfur cluster biosynthetic enzyme
MTELVEELERTIIDRLKQVIDPETQVDVIRMQLVQDLSVDSDGIVEYTFQPSSPLCPIAVALAVDIKRAVADVPGVQKQRIRVRGYLAADELTRLINKEV